MAEEKKEKFSEQNESDYGFPFVEITPLKAKEESKARALNQKVEEPKQPEIPSINPIKIEKQTAGPTPIATRKRSQVPLQFSLVMLILIILSAMAYFLYFLPEGEKQKQMPSRVELVEKAEESGADLDLLVEGDEVEEVIGVTETEDKPVETIPEFVQEQPSPSVLGPGTVHRITERGASVRYFIIVSSTPSQKVALEQAESLLKNNADVWVIYPFGDNANYRVSISQFPVFADALTAMEKSKAEFGESIWILKY